MTPMIDVVFLLLIFFVCAAAGQIPEALLPTTLSDGSAHSPQVVEPEPWVVEIWLRLIWNAAESRTIIELNDAKYDDFSALGASLRQLAELTPESPVILDIEAQVPLGDMIRAYDECRAADFESIHFAAEPAES